MMQEGAASICQNRRNTTSSNYLIYCICFVFLAVKLDTIQYILSVNIAA